jgi:hypothetical protein
MKYICFGYLEPGKFENMSESERNTVLDECFSYNDELRKNGLLVAEEPHQPANTPISTSWGTPRTAPPPPRCCKSSEYRSARALPVGNPKGTTHPGSAQTWVSPASASADGI